MKKVLKLIILFLLFLVLINNKESCVYADVVFDVTIPINNKIYVNKPIEFEVNYEKTVQTSTGKQDVGGSKTIFASSSNKNIMKVEKKGNKFILTGVSEGKADLIIEITELTASTVNKVDEKKIEITVINEERELKEEAEKEAEKAKKAFETPPGANASEMEIYTFMHSDSLYNSGNAMKNIPKETSKKWSETINVFMNSEKCDAIGRKMYYPIKVALDEYNRDGAISETSQNTMNTQTKEAEEATQKYIQELKDRLAKIGVIDEGEDRTNQKFTDVIENIDDYIPNDTVSSSDKDKIINKTNTILTIITNIAMIMSVIIPAILGIKYMLGSVEEKAEYKKDMLPYLAGAVLVFGITTIVKVMQLFGESINNL